MPNTLDRLAEALPGVARVIMRRKVDHFASVAPPRPHRYSLWEPSAPPTHEDRQTGAKEACGTWVSWPSLIDRSWTSRHLGPDRPAAEPPEADAVVGLFERGAVMKQGRSSALLGLFAQWFTDSFLRTRSDDRRRTDSNHEIDLCQIYGLDERTAHALRSHQGGELKTRRGPNGGEFAPLLFRDGHLDPDFKELSFLRSECATRDGAPIMVDRSALWLKGIDGVFGDQAPGPISDPKRRDHLYAFGLDRGGSTLIYSAINTVFIREHNNIARMLSAEYRDWDDERLFQTARLINIRQALAVVMEDYISFIGNAPLFLDRSFAEQEPWYRANRTSIEFNLLYRWHGLTPDHIVLKGERLGQLDYRWNNAPLEEHGVGAILTAASTSPGGAAELYNTPAFLLRAEHGALAFARDFCLRPFNAYRKRFGMRPYRSIEALTGGAPWTGALSDVYGGDVDAVEFTVGLFAEGRDSDDLFGDTLTTMVAHDAFTHILTNPMLAEEVHVAEVFSEAGLDYIEDRYRFADIVARACEDEGEVTLSLGNLQEPAGRAATP